MEASNLLDVAAQHRVRQIVTDSNSVHWNFAKTTLFALTGPNGIGGNSRFPGGFQRCRHREPQLLSVQHGAASQDSRISRFSFFVCASQGSAFRR
jgi:hypothetical protein